MTDFNPYQPPSELDETVDLDDLVFGTPRVIKGLAPISFSGSIGQEELTRYLAKEQDAIGCAFPLLSTITLLFAIIWAFMTAQASLMLMMTGIGVLGTLLMVTSSRWYRHLMFQASYPRWDKTVSGEMTREGIRVDQEAESIFYQWNWFSGVSINEGVVGFVPSIAAEPPVLVGTKMLTGISGEDELYEFARQAKVICLSDHANNDIAFANQQVMRSPERLRTTPAKPDAIPFEGKVTGLDTELVPREAVQRKNTERAIVIRFAILVGCLLIAAPLLMHWLTGLIVVSIFAALFFNRKGRSKKSVSKDRLLYYLIGQADSEGITTDFHVVQTKVKWTGIQVVAKTENYIVLSRKQASKMVVLRDDMFADQQQWQRLLEFAKQ